MVREIDTRNLAYNREDDGREAWLTAQAETVSDELPGEHRIHIEGINAATGTPSVLASTAAPSVSPEARITEALRHLQQTSGALGFEASAPVEFVPDPMMQTTTAGSAAVHFQQTYQGIPIFDMNRTVRFSADGTILDVTGNNIILQDVLDTTPRLNVVDAVVAAARYVAESYGAAGDEGEHEEDGHEEDEYIAPPAPLDVSHYQPGILASFVTLPNRPTVLEAGPFDQVVSADLVLFYQGPGIRLGWRVLLTFPEYLEQCLVIVAADAQSPGEMLFCQSTMSGAITGMVFEESPERTPRTPFPLPRPAADYPLNMNPPAGFPPAWCASDQTVGNSVIATLGNSSTTLQGDAGLTAGDIVFNPALPTGDDQKVLNIFYFCNYMHNFFFLLGFDEAAGNFQQRNTSLDGLPGDPVRARAHSGAVQGLANMSTGPDGSPPVMNMGLRTSSDRHTALDADVVFHEYVHGVSNRLVGGRMNAFALNQPQSRGMGEGWGDYFALTIQNFRRQQERTALGDWVTNNPGGLRRFRYDDNFPDNFGDLGTGRYVAGAPHSIGEIWAATLMAMNRRIGEELGSSQRGHQLGWQIVVDGMKLTTANPSFLTARNAILRALDDLQAAGRISAADHGAARRGAWRAFARFGMGPNAQTVGASLENVVADFNLPADL